jgi:hypothetical protein
MTDRDLLRLCLDAFDAIPVAAKARKMLKNLERVPGAYAGNGSHILCAEMVKIIRERIEK